MRLKFLLLSLLITLGVFLSGYAQAVVIESSSILMTLIPESPAPGEDISISLNSFSENLNNLLITWFVDGKVITSGIGKKNISVQAPGLGSEMLVIARVTLAENEAEVSTLIKPSRMVLLWQATDSYVPPFYKGKALPAPDTFVKVVALPEISVGGSFVNPKNLTYSWEKDFGNVQDASGFGKNSYLFRNDYLENSNIIGVTANTTDQKYSSSSTIEILMYTPRILFYRQDEALGTIWDTVLSNNYFIKNSDILLAAPYFISPKDIRRPDLLFNWSINNSPIYVENYKKLTMPLQVEEGTSGTAKVKLRIENTGKIFETAEKTINIEF